ncbi:MAG: hypothetical protein KKF56_03635 [Nanoarchaeota archaeon]|nr:hypothetical protein [Nanoarchaeota archaeon]
MEQRVKFRKGEQRKFIKLVLDKILAPSLRSLRNFGIDVSYSTLKNYYQEKNLMSLGLVRDLCGLSGIRFDSLGVEILGGGWGQVKGGKKSKR